MAKLTFSNKWGSVKVQKKAASSAQETVKSPEDLVREMKKSGKSPAHEEYREKSLSMNGLVCARCGREFPESQRHLLTVHHKDGDHHNNPADGSNWENLCVYCHEDVHSRSVLAEYLGPEAQGREISLAYDDSNVKIGSGMLAEKLQKALQKKREK